MWRLNRPDAASALDHAGVAALEILDLGPRLDGGRAFDPNKIADLVSRLVRAGAGVTVVMTRAATRLVGPKTFEALSGRPVLTRVFDRGAHPHIELAANAELLCVAPATANLLAKAACGLADDLLSTVLLTFDGPVLMAPLPVTLLNR